MIQASSSKFQEKGFTLLELIIVIFIIAVLTTIVTVNFVQLRGQQEIQAAAQDTISKIREIQNFVLTGQTQAGVTPQAYEITLAEGGETYLVRYDVGGSFTTLQTVNLTQNIKINKLYVGGIARPQIVIRITSPFGAILVDGGANQTVQIELNHARAGRIRSVVINGISGRISAQ